MKDYSKIVISLITKDGEQYNLASSKSDTKHIFAFLRLIDVVGSDIFYLKDYINSKKNKSLITGFELAKYLASKGNVIFFHTDVNNALFDKKEASLIVPDDMNYNQIDKLNNMCKCLENFKIYIGIVHNSNKNRIWYERSSISYLTKTINNYYENLNNIEENTLFEKNILYIILPNGRVVKLPKKGKEINHNKAFKKLNNLYPNLFEDYNILDGDGGYELSSYLAANGKIVLWPTDINRADMVVTSMPKLMTTEQCLSLKNLIKMINKNTILYASVLSYKKKNSTKIILESISSSGDYNECLNKIKEFLDKMIYLNELMDSEVTEIEEHSYKNL